MPFILTLITFIPLAGAILILFIPKQRSQAIKWTALIVSLVPLILAIVVWNGYDHAVGAPRFQFAEEYYWFEAISARYHVGVDGISVSLILLTALLTPLSLLYSFTIEDRPKAFFALFLFLETGMFGVFAALDFFLFFVFWEIGLIPMYFLINQWGGKNRRYASIKFFLYTLVGSVGMLLTMQALYFATGTFDLIELASIQPFTGPEQALPFISNHWAQILAFWALFLAFAIKVPMWPLHTWLPDAHTEAPTAGSVILAGVLLKMGAYGFLRIILPIFPDAAQRFGLPVAILALFSIIFGAFAAMAQKDLKRMIAYSSVNHMGYVMLGVSAVMVAAGGSVEDKAIALNGAVLQMFNHGITTGALFLLIGVIYERAHTRDLSAFGGLGVTMPLFAAMMLVTTLASLGLPGLNGFVSEFLVFRGAFPIITPITVLAGLGLLVTAVYLLWMVQRIFLGPENPKWTALPDMDRREVVALAPLVALMVIIGVAPAWILEVINESVLSLIGMM